MAPALEDVWSAEATSPAEIQDALRDLLHRRYEAGETSAPARVLNLVAVVDRAWRGEVANRLERVGRFHPSRTIICAVERGRTTLDAWATMASESEPGGLAVSRERVEIEVGVDHVPRIDTIVAPVLAAELPTLVWVPHGHAEALDALLHLANVVLIDSGEEPQVHVALARAAELAERADVVDLSWLRTRPWREHLFAIFDPPPIRRTLDQISALTVRHRQDSTAAALLLAGWFASRLGWRVNALIAAVGRLQGKASVRRQDVNILLEPMLDQDAPGLAGVTVETAAGFSLALARGPGGLAATQRTRDGSESSWTIMGASRGEIGIFEEGVRQALARDKTYRPALEAARAMLL